MIDLKAAARLRLIYDDFDGNQKEFAKLCNTSQPSINRMMNGEQPISFEVVQNISRKLKYHPDWIVNGTAPTKYTEDKTSLVTNIQNYRVEILILEARIKALEKKNEERS